MIATPLLVFVLILLGSVAGEATKQVKPILQGGRCFGRRYQDMSENIRNMVGEYSGVSQELLDGLAQKVIDAVAKQLKDIGPIHQLDEKLSGVLKQETRYIEEKYHYLRSYVRLTLRRRLSELTDTLTKKLDNMRGGGGSDGIRADIQTILENINTVSNNINNVTETIEVQKGDGGGGVSGDVSHILRRIERKLRHFNSKFEDETAILNRVESAVFNVMDAVKKVRTAALGISRGGGGGGDTTPSSAVAGIGRTDKRILSIVQQLLQIARNSQPDIQEKYELLISQSSSSVAQIRTSVRNIMIYLTNMSGDFGNQFEGFTKEIVKSAQIIERVRRKVEVTQNLMSAFNTMNSH